MKINIFYIINQYPCKPYLIILLFILASCKGPANAPAEGPIPVNVYITKEEQPVYFDLYPGNLIAENEVRLMSEVSGYITGIYFNQGQQVKKGQKLYEIEPRRYEANYQQALANYKIAQSNLERAAKDEIRYTELGRLDAIAKQRVEYAHTDFRNAKQQIGVTQAALKVAETDLKHSIIYAPFDGTIGISLVKMGTLSSAGQTQLNTISSNNPMAVDFVISEKEIGKFQELKSKTNLQEDSLFTIVLPNQEVYKYPGQIEFFDRAVDPLTGTLRIRLQFPNPDFELKAGMSCNVRVLNSAQRKSILIPSKAVTEQMGEFFVFVAKNDSARQQKIILGNNVKDKVIVNSGLQPGETIITEGIQKLHEGSPIRINTSPSGNERPTAEK